MSISIKENLYKFPKNKNKKLLILINKKVTNVYDKFWGACEVADSMIKRFIDTGDNARKCEFVGVEKSITADTFVKYTFASKPKYFVSHRGNILFFSDGLDFPKLSEEIEKYFPLLEEAAA